MSNRVDCENGGSDQHPLQKRDYLFGESNILFMLNLLVVIASGINGVYWILVFYFNFA